jgi:hypothetical protein
VAEAVGACVHAVPVDAPPAALFCGASLHWGPTVSMKSSVTLAGQSLTSVRPDQAESCFSRLRRRSTEAQDWSRVWSSTSAH